MPYSYPSFNRVELTSEPPPGRALFASAYSPVHNSTLIYGGKSADGVLQDVWLFDNPTSSWTELLSNSSSGPAAMFGMSSSYFVQGDGLIVFGGADSLGTVYNDTWLLTFPN